MAGLKLLFSTGDRPELLEVEFTHPQLQKPQVSVRGKTGGALGTSNTFQWTSAVQALSMLVVRACLSTITELRVGMIQGLAGSPAASLDYSLSKKPNWILDMFGVESNGSPLAFRVFHRTNSERRRPGPVSIAINSSVLPTGNIELLCGNNQLQSADEVIRLYTAIAAQWGDCGWDKEPLRVDVPAEPVKRGIRDEAEFLHRADSDATRSFVRAFPSFMRAAHSGRRLLERYFAEVASGPPPPDSLATADLGSAISRIFVNEARNSLRVSNIFSANGLSNAAARIESQEWFPQNVNLKSLFSRELPTSFRLALQPEETFSRFRAIEQPLHFLVCPTFSGTLSIINYLRFFKGYPVSLEYSHATAYDVLSCISKTTSDIGPTAIVLTSGGAATLMKQKGQAGFCPLMPLPSVSHRVSVARNALKAGQVWNRGEFQFWSGSPSGSLSYFNILERKGLINSKSCTFTHSEPDESAARLAQEDPDIRVLQWFPFPSLYELFLGATTVDTLTKDCFACELVMFLDARSFKNEGLRRDIENAIRAAWLDLIEQQDLVDASLTLLCQDPLFLRTIARLAGLDCLSGLVGGFDSTKGGVVNK